MAEQNPGQQIKKSHLDASLGTESGQSSTGKLEEQTQIFISKKEKFLPF